VEPTELGVQVTEGVVTLTGTVRSWAERQAAAAAWNANGVTVVTNQIEVRSA
jgi:osmotically-inducible protein OsmY